MLARWKPWTIFLKASSVNATYFDAFILPSACEDVTTADPIRKLFEFVLAHLQVIEIDLIARDAETYLDGFTDLLRCVVFNRLEPVPETE